MSQIFISYASEDRPWVEPFAKTLEKQGWSVWWDRHIPIGHTYDDVIWNALQRARCVVVVWSSHSVASEGVNEEAGDAKKRNILLPVRIDEARPPFGFSRPQPKSLVGWQDGIPHREYDQLLIDIAKVLQMPPPVRSSGGSAALARVYGYLWLILPTLLVVMAVVGLMAWRVPTHVQLALTVDRIEFTVGSVDSGSVSLLAPLEVQALTIREFSHVPLSPQAVEIADPRLYDFDKDTYPASAWHPVTMTDQAVEFVAGDAARHPTVVFQDASSQRQPPTASAGRLDSVALVDGARLTLQRSGDSGTSLTVDIEAEQPRTVLTPAPVFQVSTTHTTLKGATLPAFAQSEGQTYRITLKGSQPTVEVNGSPTKLGLTVRPLDRDDHISFSQAIPITAIDFYQQGSTGGRMTSLTDGAEAVLTYPDYPDVPGARFMAPDVLGLEELDRFVIQDIEWSAASKGIRIMLDGVAGYVAIKSGAFTEDHRLTQFAKLRHNPSLMTVLAILGWVVPTLIGARKLFMELR